MGSSPIASPTNDLEQYAEDASRRPLLVTGVHAIEDRLEVFSPHQAHREVDAPFGVHTHLVHGYDAGVVELARDLGLFEEPASTFEETGGVSPVAWLLPAGPRHLGAIFLARS